MTLGDGTILGFAASPEFGRDGICLVASRDGLLKTSDRGVSWQSPYGETAETSGFPTTAVTVSPSFAQDGVVLASIPGGIGRSDDAGATWRFTQLPLPPPLISCLTLSPDFGRDGCAFAGSLQDGVLRSDDGGTTWQAWNAGLFDHEVLSLAISPNFADDRTLFVGTGTGLFRSRNAGRSWTACGMPTDDPAILTLAAGPTGALFAGTEDAGLWHSPDLGGVWIRVGAEILPDEIQSVLSSPNGAALVFGDRIAARSGAAGDSWAVLTGLPADAKDALMAVLAAAG